MWFAAFADALMSALRRIGLDGTDLAKATCGTCPPDDQLRRNSAAPAKPLQAAIITHDRAFRSVFRLVVFVKDVAHLGVLLFAGGLARRLGFFTRSVQRPGYRLLLLGGRGNEVGERLGQNFLRFADAASREYLLKRLNLSCSEVP